MKPMKPYKYPIIRFRTARAAGPNFHGPGRTIKRSGFKLVQMDAGVQYWRLNWYAEDGGWRWCEVLFGRWLRDRSK